MAVKDRFRDISARDYALNEFATPGGQRQNMSEYMLAALAEHFLCQKNMLDAVGGEGRLQMSQHSSLQGTKASSWCAAVSTTKRGVTKRRFTKKCLKKSLRHIEKNSDKLILFDTN